MRALDVAHIDVHMSEISGAKAHLFCLLAMALRVRAATFGERLSLHCGPWRAARATVYTAAPCRFNRPRAALVSTIFGALARDENANRQPKNLEDRDLGTWKAALASFVS